MLKGNGNRLRPGFKGVMKPRVYYGENITATNTSSSERLITSEDGQHPDVAWVLGTFSAE